MVETTGEAADIRDDFIEACKASHAAGVNPGGEVRGAKIEGEQHDAKFRPHLWVLRTRDEWDRIWPGEMVIEKGNPNASCVACEKDGHEHHGAH